MKHTIIAAGKPSLKYCKDGVAEYQKRLKRYGTYELKHIKDGSSEAVSNRHLEHSNAPGTIRIVLDERGELLTTDQLLKKINLWEMNGQKNATYHIGASDGHTEELRKNATLVWALSPLTLQHELALTVLLEQLYRIATIKKGEPYHR